MSRYLILGKAGDVLSCLPCLQAEFKETGIKPSLIVAKEYAALPKALPWLQVEEFQGSFEDINGAIKWAKQSGKIDFIPQMSGLNHAPARKHPSFQLDQWSRMGRLDQWKELTLELPRCGIMFRSIPMRSILVADHSQSSPFAQIEDLCASLSKEFPNRTIKRLSTIRAGNILEFLQIYEESDLLISIDTMHLHLSRARKTPVIALVTDQPGTWWGSAYHPRFKMHCRYADYELRKSELIWTAKEILKTS